MIDFTEMPTPHFVNSRCGMDGTTLPPRDRAEFYADLYDVPIDEIEQRYGLVLLEAHETPPKESLT